MKRSRRLKDRKTGYGTVSGAVSILAVAIARWMGLDMSPEVASAVGTVAVAAVSFLTSHESEVVRTTKDPDPTP